MRNKTPKGLTPAQEAFAGGVASGLSQAEAYRRAYPSSLKWADETVWRKASLLAGHGDVQARVSEITAKAAKANELTAERVLGELCSLAFFDPADFAQIKGPADLKNLPADVRKAIAGWSWTKEGKFVLKFATKQTALDTLAQHLGLLKQRIEHSVEPGLAERLARARKACGG